MSTRVWTRSLYSPEPHPRASPIRGCLRMRLDLILALLVYDYDYVRTKDLVLNHLTSKSEVLIGIYFKITKVNSKMLKLYYDP